MSAFADPDIIRMANEEYVSVTGDDWYQRRRQDKEGEFFRKVADAAGRKGEGGGTPTTTPDADNSQCRRRARATAAASSNRCSSAMPLASVKNAGSSEVR